MGLSVILGDLHKTPVQTPSIANRKTAPPPQVMLIIVETNWTLVHKIQVCISPYDGAIIHLQSVCGGQIILYFKYYRSSPVAQHFVRTSSQVVCSLNKPVTFVAMARQSFHAFR